MEIQKIKNIVFWIMIIFIIGLGIYLIYYVNSESFKCMNNPLVYGVSKYKDEQEEFSCSCGYQNSIPFVITKEGVKEGYSNLKIVTG